MSTQRTILVAGFVLAAGCASTQASRPSTQLAASHCGDLTERDARTASTLAAHNVERVEAIHATRYFNGQDHALHVTGANVYVAAAPGVSDAYLERVLSCYAAAGAGQPSGTDPLRVAGVSEVRVRSHGPSFEIAITGRDREAGEQILQQARALERSGGEVQIRQIAQSPSARTSF
jgi:hypothetical protein